MGILITLLILSILILIHEGGHFTAAKLFGIKVEEFGFGLPPRAWGKKIGETIYSINWLPIGGFVKLFGEDEAGGGSLEKTEVLDEKKMSAEEKRRAFFTRPVWQRAIVVVAGVVMNALLAFAIYYLYFNINGFKAELPNITEHTFFGAKQEKKLQGIIITQVSKNSPAEKSGLKGCSSDGACEYTVTHINKQRITDGDAFIALIKKYSGKEITLTVKDIKTEKTREVSLVPRINPPKGEGALGIGFAPIELYVLSYETPTQVAFSGVTYPLNLMAYNYKLMKVMVQRSLAEKNPSAVSNAVSGPVGIFSLGGSINAIPDGRQRFLQYLNLAGILSISLAFFNVLPIPALDGGRLFFILIEGIFRKKVSQAFENRAHSIGMAILIGLILLVTLKDIFQLVK